MANELITKEGKLVPEVISEVVALELSVKALKKHQEELRQAIKEAMEENGVKSFECDELKITYIDETWKASVDTKALEREDIETYRKYLMSSPVKSSIKITVREKKA